MKIAMVGPFFPLVGGTATFLGRLVPGIEKQGNQCILFSTGSGNPHLGIIERIQRLFFFVQLSLRVSLTHCDLVHAHAVNWANLFGIGLLMMACRFFRKPIVLTLHAGNLLEKLGTVQSRRFALWILSLPRVVTTVTPELGAVLTEMGIKNVCFIPNEFVYASEEDLGPIPNEIERFLSSHRPVIVSVGAMEHVHGIDVLVKALPILLSLYPSLGVIIIAYKSVDIQYQNEIIKLIIELNLAGIIIFPKQLPSVISVIKSTDLLVRATLSDGDSIAIREALALGIPVVASDVGFRPKDVVRFPAGDHIQLAEKITEVLSSPKGIFRTNLGSDLETIGKYLQVYQFALNR